MLWLQSSELLQIGKVPTNPQLFNFALGLLFCVKTQFYCEQSKEHRNQANLHLRTFSCLFDCLVLFTKMIIAPTSSASIINPSPLQNASTGNTSLQKNRSNSLVNFHTRNQVQSRSILISLKKKKRMGKPHTHDSDAFMSIRY